MKNVMMSTVVFAMAMGGGCITDEADELEAQPEEELTQLLAPEEPDVAPDESILRKRGDLISPAHASCGTRAPNLENRRVSNASSPNAARQRRGSSTGCIADGALQPTDDAIYFCYTSANDGFTWTYLQNVRTGVRGWVRDDLLRLIGGIRGANLYCGF